VTARTEPSLPAQKMRLNLAIFRAFCAPGWRVTWRRRDPRIRALSRQNPRSCTPRLARDMVAVRSPLRPPPCFGDAPDGAAAAHARQHGNPVCAGHGAFAPDAAGGAAGILGYRPSASSRPTEPARIAPGTRYIVWNTAAASATVCRTASAHPRAAGPPYQGGSTCVSRPRVNSGERRSLASYASPRPSPSSRPSA
jgi:hypothetical protein